MFGKPNESKGMVVGSFTATTFLSFHSIHANYEKYYHLTFIGVSSKKYIRFGFSLSPLVL